MKYYSGVFRPVESKSVIHFRQPAQEFPDNLEFLSFSELSRVFSFGRRKSKNSVRHNACKLPLIKFSGINLSFGRRDSADCKQRRTK